MAAVCSQALAGPPPPAHSHLAAEPLEGGGGQALRGDQLPAVLVPALDVHALVQAAVTGDEGARPKLAGGEVISLAHDAVLGGGPIGLVCGHGGCRGSPARACGLEAPGCCTACGLWTTLGSDLVRAAARGTKGQANRRGKSARPKIIQVAMAVHMRDGGRLCRPSDMLIRFALRPPPTEPRVITSRWP